MRKIVETLGAMAELSGKKLSPEAIELLSEELMQFPEPRVLKALSACRRELKFFPTLAEIIARLDDGHPGPEEAWAMIAKDEASSTVMTDQMGEAFGVARPLLLEGDEVAARMTFREVYNRLLIQARGNNTPPNWWISLGTDKSGRVMAVTEAVQKGRITHAQAVKLLPHEEIRAPGVPQIAYSEAERAQSAANVAKLRSMVQGMLSGPPEGSQTP